MSRGLRITLFTLGLIAAVILFLPLRLLVPTGTLAAREVTGSIWSGWLIGAQAGPVALGDLHMGLRWPGVLRVSVPGANADKLRAYVSRGAGGGVLIDNASGKVPLDLSYGILRISQLDFRKAKVDFGANGCTAASGRVIASAAATLPVPVPPLSLSGTLDCRGKDLVAALKSQSGLELVDVTLFANGAWQVRATLRPASPELAAALRAAGFQETPLGYVRTEQGGDAR